MKNHIDNSKNYFCTKLVILALIGSLTFSGMSITIAQAAEIPYNATEVLKIKAFLEKQSMVEGKTNADLLGITDLNSPGTWTGVGWTDKHPDSPILEPIMLENKHVQYIQWPQSLGSSLEISGFSYLQMFQLNHYGGSYGDRSIYSDISIHDNPLLESVRIVYASVGIIRIAQNPKLYGVSLDLVDTRELVIESPVLRSLGSSTMGSGTLNFAAYPILEELHLTGCNNVTTLDLSSCPNIGNLSATGMKNMKTIRFGKKQGIIATVSGNPALTSIDFRSLQPVFINCCGNSSLVDFQIDKNTPLTKAEINGNNALTKLDLSYQPDLKILYCEGNSSLKELLVQGNTSLEYIYCDGCALTSLDVSGLSSLKVLMAMENQLTEFSATDLQFTKLALLWNKLKKISANVGGFNISVKSHKEYGNFGFSAGNNDEDPNDPNSYIYLIYNGLKDPEPRTYFREVIGTGWPEGEKSLLSSSFQLKSDIDVTLYFECYVHFVSWFESATGDPYDEKAVLSLKHIAGLPIGPTPPDSASKFPANIPPPVKKGYKLQGWYKDMELTQPWNLLTDNLTPNLVLFPCWIPEGYPMVVSVRRLSPASENAETDHVTYNVTFSKTVSGIDISDFKLTSEGTVTGKIASVSAANGNTISVEVNTINGTGTLRLDVKNSGTGIVDANSNPLAGGFTSGETYSFGTATAVDDFTIKGNNVRVFPNPTNGILHIENSGFEPIYRLEIVNVQGKQVFQQNITDNNYINLIGFPSGIYLVKIYSASAVLTYKILKTGY